MNEKLIFACHQMGLASLFSHFRPSVFPIFSSRGPTVLRHLAWKSLMYLISELSKSPALIMLDWKGTRVRGSKVKNLHELLGFWNVNEFENRTDDKIFGPLGEWGHGKNSSLFFSRCLLPEKEQGGQSLWARCVSVPPTWGHRTPLAA